MPVLRRQDQGRGIILPRVVLVGASIAEQMGHLQVPVQRRGHQGCGSVPVPAAVWPKRQSQQALHFRTLTLACCTQETAKSIGIIIGVLQPDELKSKAWKGGQDLVVLHLIPCWQDKKALAEDADALARLHVALDVQDRAGAWKIQHEEVLIRECVDDLHHAIAPVSCHASAYAGPAQAETLGP